MPFGSAETTTAKFDLLLTAKETGAGIRLTWQYGTDLFEVATIERMHDHFLHLLNAIVADPDLSEADLPILSLIERAELLIGSNNTHTSFRTDLCLHNYFEQQVERTPEAIALVNRSHKLW